jgi:hypothetical protein
MDGSATPDFFSMTTGDRLYTDKGARALESVPLPSPDSFDKWSEEGEKRLVSSASANT